MKSNFEMVNSDLLKRIVIDSDMCQGKPGVRGLRYPVQNILELLASGMSSEEILENSENRTLSR